MIDISFQIFSDLPTAALLGAFAIAFVAGAVKGAIGFAMPLIIVATVSLFIDPKIVVAGLIFPILFSNVSQMMRQGPAAAWAAMKEFRWFLVPMVFFIFGSAQLMGSVETKHIFLFLGVSVTVLSAIQLVGWKPVVPDAWRVPAALFMGSFAGMMGGFGGTWGPPAVLYLLALDTPKAKQVVVQGVMFGLGGGILMAGHLTSGILSAYTVPFSLALIVPVFAGMLVGYRIQDRIPQIIFRRATLAVLFVIGLNLVRRAVFG